MERVFDNTGADEVHPALEIMEHTTWSPSAGTNVKAGLFEPAGDPLTFHSKTGELPPLKGDAVSVTELPVHTGLAEAVIDTDTGMAGVTDMVTRLERTTAEEGQLTDEVILQLTMSPLAGRKVY